MGYVIRMPQLGMSMDEGTVVEWTLGEGEEVTEGDVVVVVESEKASNDVEAREDGVVRRVLVEAGGVVEPGTPIGILAGPDEDLSQFESQLDGDLDDGDAATDADEDSATAGSAAGGSSGAGGAAGAEDVRATPGARSLASDEDVDLAAVEGTGPQGVVTEEDVERYAEESGGGSAEAEDVRATPGARSLAGERGVDLTAVEGTGPQGVVTEEDVERHAEEGGDAAAGSATRTVTESRPLSGMQKTVADRLSESYREAVHVTLNRSYDTGVVRAVAAAGREAGADGSLTDLLVKAVGETLGAHPEFNAVFEDGEHRLVEEANVGVAVDVEAGLVVPVIPSVRERSVESVNAVRGQKTGAVQSGEFTMDDLSGGTFTISNLGVFGIDDFDPIINPPEVAILGVGRIRDDDTMTLSLSFDHRVVNGADAARFLDTLVETLTDASALAGFYDADVDAADVDVDDAGATAGATGSDADAPTEPRDIRVENPEGYAGQYRTAFGDVAFDEPEDHGGSGTAPSPVDHLLGALGSCLSLSVRAMAQRDDVPVGEVSCDVQGSPDGGPLKRVAVELELETDADEDAVEKVVTKAERACHVNRALSEDLPVSLKWTRS